MNKYVYKYTYDCPPTYVESKEYKSKSRCIQACIASILRDCYGEACDIRIENTDCELVCNISFGIMENTPMIPLEEAFRIAEKYNSASSQQNLC